ncbi:MAG: molybdenum cofactor guanylyltransferase [Sphingobacteriaceae bacterium]|nr:MAG: molybdenum cofactor guanylyltransferase [Sphingobacteriaceae bacterium]
MGKNKAEMNWHGKEQQYHLADLLGFYCDEVFISCGKNQEHNINIAYKTIPDLQENASPMEAILNAFEKYPDKSWLVVACDLPLLDKQTLDYLAVQRDETKIATTFVSPEDTLPEPLIAIWELVSYSLLKLSYQENHLSLRKVLIAKDTQIIKAPNADALINANTPEDAGKIEKLIGLKNTSFIR